VIEEASDGPRAATELRVPATRTCPPASTEARICTFECTFCADCVAHELHERVAPTAAAASSRGPSGRRRPWRPGISLAERPASRERVHLSYSHEDIAASRRGSGTSRPRSGNRRAGAARAHRSAVGPDPRARRVTAALAGASSSSRREAGAGKTVLLRAFCDGSRGQCAQPLGRVRGAAHPGPLRPALRHRRGDPRRARGVRLP
jgi:hypothetical protein